MDDTTAPSFVTHREVDLFLGGGDRGPRKRLRLRDRELLPPPADLGRVRAYNLTLFPRFALVGLMDEVAQLQGAKDYLARLTREAYGIAAFAQLAEAVRASACEMDSWRYDALVNDVAERARPAFREWSLCVYMAEQELHERFDIGFESTPGTVEEATPVFYVVSIAGGRTERFPADRVAAPVAKGCRVAIERVRVMGNEMDFVLPVTAEPGDVEPDAEDRELAEWLSEMMAPAAETESLPQEEDDSHAEELPYRRAAPRRAGWRGGGTMSRIPAG